MWGCSALCALHHFSEALESLDSDEGKKKFDGTMVDMGEDLLEPTGADAPPSPTSSPTTRKPEPAAPKPQAFDVLEEVQRGEILHAERLFDEAKKVFRKILRRSPGNETAKKFLDDIQKQEIQDLLGGEAPRKRLGALDTSEDDNPARVLERLEKELRINLDRADIKPVPDLFDSIEAFGRYREKILETAVALPPRDRIDIGIAHLEMGMFDIAQAIFEGVVRYDEHKLSGMYLLGVALIYGGKAIEATIRLEPLCRDLTLGEGPKTDYMYLMGLAFERLNDTRKAREFYRRVAMLNPRYRDVPDKLK